MVRRRNSSSADGTRGGEHERGTPPSLGGLGVSRENFELIVLLCAFIMGFYAFGTRFQSRFFARKDISLRMRKPNAKQNRFQIVMIFFTFFFSIFLRHYVTYVPAGYGKVLLALILGCHGRIQRGDRVSGPPPLTNHKKLGFLSNTGPDLLKNHKLPSQHSVLGHYPFKWRFAGGPMMARL